MKWSICSQNLVSISRKPTVIYETNCMLKACSRYKTKGGHPNWDLPASQNTRLKNNSLSSIFIQRAQIIKFEQSGAVIRPSSREKPKPLRFWSAASTDAMAFGPVNGNVLYSGEDRELFLSEGAKFCSGNSRSQWRVVRGSSLRQIGSLTTFHVGRSTTNECQFPQASSLFYYYRHLSNNSAPFAYIPKPVQTTQIP